MLNDVMLIVNQIANKYQPKQVLLFGSQANGTATIKSDIDLCVVLNTDTKRKLLTDMYCNIDAETPFDLLIYTPAEWNNCIDDKSSFAYKLNANGVILYEKKA